jgi:hypothetical protein
VRRLTTVLATALAAVTVLGTAPAAHAERASIKDKRADVVRTTYSADDLEVREERRLTKTASRRSGIDATSVRYDHRSKTVSVTVRFARLKSDAGLYAEIYAPGSKKADFEVYGRMGSSVAEVVDPEYDVVCSGDFSSRTGKKGWMRLTVKRSCLGDLRKVRMAAGAYRTVEDGDAFVVYGDALSAKKVRTPHRTRLLAAG